MLSIRKATLSDSEELSTLAKQLYHASYDPYFDQKILNYFLINEFDIDKIRFEIDSKKIIFLLGVVDCKIIAYIKINIINHGCERNLIALEIDKLYVLAEFQRDGLGKTLVEEAINIFKHKTVSSVSTSVFSKNDKAEIFYKKLGFIKSGGVEFKLGGLTMTDFMYVKKL